MIDQPLGPANAHDLAALLPYGLHVVDARRQLEPQLAAFDHAARSSDEPDGRTRSRVSAVTSRAPSNTRNSVRIGGGSGLRGRCDCRSATMGIQRRRR